MTAMENLGDNQEIETTLPESLTDQEASDAIKFSPELAGGKMERQEYLRNLASSVDMNKVKELITDPNFNLLDEKDVLIREYGFTEEEIMEGERYLEEARANPDMIESDIENEIMPRWIPIIWIIIGFGAGVGVTECSHRGGEVTESVYVEAGEWDMAKEVFKFLTAEQEFKNVTGTADMTKELSILFFPNIQRKKRKVSLQIDGKVSACFDNKHFLDKSKVHEKSDGEGNIEINMNIPKPDLMVSDVVLHDIRVEEGFLQRFSPSHKLDKATEDAYNNAINSVVNSKKNSNDFYELARQSLEKNMEAYMKNVLDQAGKQYKSIKVNVKYTNDSGHVYYNGDQPVQQSNNHYTPRRQSGRR